MAALSVTWEQVFAWRLRRQFLEPRGAVPAEQIVRRLCGVQAQVASSAAQAVAVRQSRPKAGAVDAALAARRLMKTWSVRGTLHLLPPDLAGALGCLIASARTWEKPAWIRAFGLTPKEMAELADRVPAVLDGRTLTREELIEALATSAKHAEHLRSGWGTALKPLAWLGLLCHGPSQGSRITFTSPASWAPDWQPYTDVEQAAAVAIPAYLGAYGPATPTSFGNWLSRSASGKASLRRWFASLGDRLVTVDVAGTSTYLPAEYVDELAGVRPSRAVRLLGPFDQYLLGPGTDDAHVLDPRHRPDVSKAAGWIAPIVVAKGRVAGIWSGGAGSPVSVTEFEPIDAKALAAEVRRVS